MEKLTGVEFAARVREELDHCAVGRDNPVHRMLVAGKMDVPMLRILGVQQWAFHAAFPGNLALIAGRCPERSLRARLLRDAYQQDPEPGKNGRCAQWEQVCSVWGLTPEDLRTGRILATTEAMLAIQEYVAQRAFGEAFAGLTIAVNGEATPHLAARRAAMEKYYGVTGPNLAYFEGFIPDDPAHIVNECIEVVDRHSFDRQMQEDALRAIRLVLRARWEYFSGIAS